MRILYLSLFSVFLFFSAASAFADDLYGNSTTPALSAPQIAPSSPDSPTSPISPVSGANRGYVEVGGDYSTLDKGYKDWYGEYLRSSIRTDAKNTWNLEIDNQNEYSENGQFESLGNTHIWNDRIYTSVSAGTSEGGNVYLPSFRTDGFIYEKWLDNKSLITNVGLGYYDSKISHYHDESVSFGATYYFQRPWIIEGGVRLDFSDPGGVFAPMAFTSVTWGHNKADFVTMRYAYGKEAYLLLGGSTTPEVGFYSNEVDLIWRHWFHHGPWGFNARAEYYASPAYDRTGGTFGIFREF